MSSNRFNKMLLRNSIAAVRHFSAVAKVANTRATKDSGGGGDTLGRRLLSLVYAKRSAVITIGKWKEEGGTVRKYELNRIVRELRKLRRYKHAIEVGFSENFVCFFLLFMFTL